jgi:hypothetical protein
MTHPNMRTNQFRQILSSVLFDYDPVEEILDPNRCDEYDALYPVANEDALPNQISEIAEELTAIYGAESDSDKRSLNIITAVQNWLALEVGVSKKDVMEILPRINFRRALADEIPLRVRIKASTEGPSPHCCNWVEIDDLRGLIELLEKHEGIVRDSAIKRAALDFPATCDTSIIDNKAMEISELIIGQSLAWLELGPEDSGEVETVSESFTSEKLRKLMEKMIEESRTDLDVSNQRDW